MMLTTEPPRHNPKMPPMEAEITSFQCTKYLILILKKKNCLYPFKYQKKTALKLNAL